MTPGQMSTKQRGGTIKGDRTIMEIPERGEHVFGRATWNELEPQSH